MPHIRAKAMRPRTVRLSMKRMLSSGLRHVQAFALGFAFSAASCWTTADSSTTLFDSLLMSRLVGTPKVLSERAMRFSTARSIFPQVLTAVSVEPAEKPLEEVVTFS